MRSEPSRPARNLHVDIPVGRRVGIRAEQEGFRPSPVFESIALGDAQKERLHVGHV
jgi:hypothetical protein